MSTQSHDGGGSRLARAFHNPRHALTRAFARGADAILHRLVRGHVGELERAAGERLTDLAVARFLDPSVGAAHAVGTSQKRALIEAFKRNTAAIPSATRWEYHLTLAQELLEMPPTVVGDVVECGCWKGSATASLSAVCRLVGRRLIVCDSFQGLPADEPEVVHRYPHLRVYGYYEPGMYAASLDEVKANVGRYGALEVCDFVPGFFSETLPTLSRPVAMAFLDVDLASSLRDCIRALWPLLVEGGAIYTDDSCDMEAVRVWFDGAWWREALGQEPPGYVGSGCGLPLSPTYTSLGYARKVSAADRAYGRVGWLRYREEPR